MPNTFHHGVRVIEINEGTRAVRVPSTAVIGLVATAPDAEANIFPLDEAVLFTNINDAISAAGATGTLKQTLELISKQAKPLVVVVRVAEGVDGEDEPTTEDNVIGTIVNGKKTGLQALLSAQSKVGVKPRIIGCPGLDTEAVTMALVSVAQELRAFAYALNNGGNTLALQTSYRAKFAARELMLLSHNWLDSDGDSLSSVATALGLRAQIDSQIGWHKTLSNVPVNGVSGIDGDVSWDLQNPNTDANLLNAADITTLIQNTGFRFWGSRTCSEEPLFAFESYTRTAHVLADMMAEGVAWASDKPLTPTLVKDILETINAAGRALVNAGLLLGFEAWVDPDANPATGIKDGKFAIDYDYTPIPPMENLTLRQRITDRYLVDFSARVAQA